MNAKPAISFLIRYPDALLVVAINRILESMTGNPVYPAPVPTLAEIATARDAYVSAVNANDRGKLAILNRNEARANVTGLVRELALYVQRLCNGDPVKLASSGFSAQRGRQPVGTLRAPTNVRLRLGPVTGQILARCDRIGSAYAYQWRIATAAAPTAWTIYDNVPTASYTLENLVRGTDYIVQVRAFGTKGPSDWSMSGTLMAG